MKKQIVKFISFIIFLSVFLNFNISNLYANDSDRIISQMIESGYNQAQADRLLANWSTAKHGMVKYARINQGNKDKLGVLAQICQNRFKAREDAVMGAVKDAMKAGYSKPIDALVPTGSWKKALSIDPNKSTQSAFDYVMEGSVADIDETLFGKVDAVEYVTEQASFRYAQRALGKKIGKNTEGYQAVNKLMTDAEVTFFPRDPKGRYSPEFEDKFPSIVLESYRGPEGQRNLDVGYLVNKQKGLADIIHYDARGNIIRVVENQPAESVLENLNDTRYTTLQRISKAKQDYSHKYVDQVLKKGLTGDDRIEWAAKMLERMYGDEAAITGRSLKGNQLFEDAQNVKKIMRTIKDPAARAAAIKKDLHCNSLDDFVKAAEKEMKWMDFQNRQRAAWMLDDDIGRAAKGARLGTLLKGLSLLSDGATIADAYLRSHEGDRLNAVSRALVVSLAADIAGTTVGKVVGTQVGTGVAAVVGRGAGVVAGGAAGITSGAIAGAIAAYVVDGTWQWTEAGVNNMLRGYKGNDAVKKIFLSDDQMVSKFLKMTPDEIKKKINYEWGAHYQFGGAYVGNLSGDHKDIKQYMLEKAIEHQFLLKKGKLEAQIYGNILRQELEKLVQKMESGKLTPDELSKIRARFGRNTSAMVNDKLQNDPKYESYKKLLNKVNDAGGKPGLWDRLKSTFDFRSKPEVEKDVNARFDRIIEIYDSLDGQLTDYWSRVSAFYAVLNQEGAIDAQALTGAFNDTSINLTELKRELGSMRTNVDLFLADLLKTFGELDDSSQFNYKKGEASVLLTAMIERVNAAIARFSELEHIMKIKQKADRMNEEAEKELKRKEESKDDEVPGFVKKSKVKKKVDPPAFVKKSKAKPKKEPLPEKKITKESSDADDKSIVQGKLPERFYERSSFSVYCSSFNVYQYGKLDSWKEEEREILTEFTTSFNCQGKFVGRTFTGETKQEKDYTSTIRGKKHYNHKVSQYKARAVLNEKGTVIESYSISKLERIVDKATGEIVQLFEASVSGGNVPIKDIFRSRFEGKQAGDYVSSFSYRWQGPQRYYKVTGYSLTEDSSVHFSF